MADTSRRCRDPDVCRRRHICSSLPRFVPAHHFTALVGSWDEGGVGGPTAAGACRLARGDVFAGEDQFEEGRDVLMLLRLMPERKVGVDLVVVPAAFLHAADVAGLLQLGEDALRVAFKAISIDCATSRMRMPPAVAPRHAQGRGHGLREEGPGGVLP